MEDRIQTQRRKKKNSGGEGEVAGETARAASTVSEWGPLVLPYLPPPSLASAALVCKALHRSAVTITARRTSDATRGLERHPVSFRNPVDSQPYAYFPLYTPASVPCFPSSLHPQCWGGAASPSVPKPLVVASSAPGCACEMGNCNPARNQGDTDGNEDSICPCSWLHPDFAGSGPVVEMMTQCGPSCHCGIRCGNRSTQGGILVKLSIVKDPKKGWGVHAAQLIKKGTFVCEYAGEFLTTAEACQRQRSYDNLTENSKFSPALFVMREHLPSGKACLRVNIDATRVGNVARFINHSCDGGNLLPIVVRNSGSVLPQLCFFAAVDILEGEEISFSYGNARLRKSGRPCFCGSPECLGTLPSEET